MALGIDHHVHYRCQFTLTPQRDTEAKWGDIPYEVRRWIRNRAERNDGFQGRWFFTGGQWKPSGDNRFSIQTARFVGNGDECSPQFWSVRYEHADDDFFARQWRTDIGLTLAQDNTITLTLLTIHWIQPGFIGKEPEPPIPTAPGIIGMLLNMRDWKAFAGSTRLSQNAKEVKEGYGHVFRDELFDDNRQVPIILISKQYATGKPLLDSSRLARLLAGTALVYESETSLVDKELEYLFDSDYRCWNGRVRAYQTGLNPDRWNDAKRHRYFTSEDIATIGDSAVVEILVRGIVRRPQLRIDSALTTLEDIQSKVQADHLTKLRASVPSKDEWIGILEADNQRLSEKVSSKEKDAIQWYAEAERLQSVDEENRVLEFRCLSLSKETANAKDRADSLESQARVLTEMEGFPDSLRDVAKFVDAAFPGKLMFTERAEKDMDDCRLRDLNAAWRCLKAMATHLYRLHFTDKIPMRELVKQFESAAPFELAVTESKNVRNNNKLMQQRVAVYKGAERDFTSHVKFGVDPGNLLRVHYYADNDDKVLVIGRCGDHLETKSTN